MPIYRVLTNLALGDKVIPAGLMHRLSTVSARGIERLKMRGAIAPVSAPPLAVVPGWKTRAARLEPFGIVGADAFLDADRNHLATVLRVPVERIDRWKDEIQAHLLPPPGAPPRG